MSYTYLLELWAKNINGKPILLLQIGVSEKLEALRKYERENIVDSNKAYLITRLKIINL